MERAGKALTRHGEEGRSESEFKVAVVSGSPKRNKERYEPSFYFLIKRKNNLIFNFNYFYNSPTCWNMRMHIHYQLTDTHILRVHTPRCLSDKVSNQKLSNTRSGNSGVYGIDSVSLRRTKNTF